jgi:hypothetical protein
MTAPFVDARPNAGRDARRRCRRPPSLSGGGWTRMRSNARPGGVCTKPGRYVRPHPPRCARHPPLKGRESLTIGVVIPDGRRPIGNPGQMHIPLDSRFRGNDSALSSWMPGPRPGMTRGADAGALPPFQKGRESLTIGVVIPDGRRPIGNPGQMHVALDSRFRGNDSFYAFVDAPRPEMVWPMRHNTPVGSTSTKSRMPHGRSSGRSVFVPYLPAIPCAST